MIGYPKKAIKGQSDKIVGQAQFGKKDILIANFISLKLIVTALSFETEKKSSQAILPAATVVLRGAILGADLDALR